MSDLRKDAQELAERFSDTLYAPTTAVDLSTGYATLRIDMSLLTEEERCMVYEAESRLYSAGIIFDTNSGQGFRNWELDWSLSGAILETKPLICSVLCCEVVQPERWACYETGSGRIVKYAYCSMSCREQDIERVNEELGWKCLVRL